MEKQEKSFEEIKHIDGENEYWLARELQPVLDYVQWRNFYKVINTAMIACKISGHEVSDHFAKVSKIVAMPSKGKKENLGFADAGKTKKIIDYKLTRYACYLIVMNGDKRKEIVYSWRYKTKELAIG